jgi:hypothetical protein
VIAATAKRLDADTSGAEHEIDALVYSWYGLSSDDIRIVERSVELEGLSMTKRAQAKRPARPVRPDRYGHLRGGVG